MNKEEQFYKWLINICNRYNVELTIKITNNNINILINNEIIISNNIDVFKKEINKDTYRILYVKKPILDICYKNCTV